MEEKCTIKKYEKEKYGKKSTGKKSKGKKSGKPGCAYTTPGSLPVALSAMRNDIFCTTTIVQSVAENDVTEEKNAGKMTSQKAKNVGKMTSLPVTLLPVT